MRSRVELRLLVLLPLLASCGGAAPAPGAPGPRPKLAPAVARLLGAHTLDAVWPQAPDHTLPNAACAELVGWKGPVEDCGIIALAGGTAARIWINTECGGDSCASESWYFARGAEQGAKGSFAELSADHVLAFEEELVTEPGGVVPVHRKLVVRNRETEVSRDFATCGSPRLSPGGAWIVCRDRAANVLRVPVGGGAPEMVVESGHPKELIAWIHHWNVYPDPVSFPSPGRMRYQVLLDENRVDLDPPHQSTFEVDWVE